VQPLVENIRKAIMSYQTENYYFPDHIIVFRGDAYEGEFKRVSVFMGLSFKLRLISDQFASHHNCSLPTPVKLSS
jgi:hypothetical protein